MTENSLKESLQTIGNSLHKVRQEKGEKIEVVAGNIGIDHSVISRIENGRYEGLSIKLLSKITTYYGIDLADLLQS